MLIFLFICMLCAVSVIDARTHRIPNIFPICICIVAFAKLCFSPGDCFSYLVGSLLVSLPMLVLACRRGGLGGGDIKLVAACGLYLGADSILLAVFLASLLALFTQIFLFFYYKFFSKHVHPHTFAFGPFLAIGCIFAALC